MPAAASWNRASSTTREAIQPAMSSCQHLESQKPDQGKQKGRRGTGNQRRRATLMRQQACSPIMHAALEDEPSIERPPTILVVDDVVLARTVAASQLRYHGFAVIEVSNADEAMRILDAPAKVALVFADVHLEGSSL